MHSNILRIVKCIVSPKYLQHNIPPVIQRALATVLGLPCTFGHSHIPAAHAEKSCFRCQITTKFRFWILYFRLIWYRTQFWLVPNQLENCYYNSNLVRFNKFKKIFVVTLHHLCVLASCILDMGSGGLKTWKRHNVGQQFYYIINLTNK